MRHPVVEIDSHGGAKKLGMTERDLGRRRDPKHKRKSRRNKTVTFLPEILHTRKKPELILIAFSLLSLFEPSQLVAYFSPWQLS